jgi:ferredoxin
VSPAVQTQIRGTSRLAHAADTSTDPDNERFDLLPGEPLGHDLLKHRAVSAVMRSRWYPGAFQIPIAAVFGLVAYELLAGPPSASDNAGTALMWVLWWPLIPILYVLFGRLWCAVCPFAALSDLVQKLVGANRPVPALLKRYGIWIIDATFIAITWADHVFGIVESPWGSGILLLLTFAVIVSGAFFQRRTFCRYLCFLGGLSGNYSRTGMLALRANPDVCATCTAKAACYSGTDTVAPCPLFSFPRTMDSSANCNLCGNCIKACPNDAITLTVHAHQGTVVPAQPQDRRVVPGDGDHGHRRHPERDHAAGVDHRARYRQPSHWYHQLPGHLHCGVRGRGVHPGRAARPCGQGRVLQEPRGHRKELRQVRVRVDPARSDPLHSSDRGPWSAERGYVHVPHGAPDVIPGHVRSAIAITSGEELRIQDSPLGGLSRLTRVGWPYVWWLCGQGRSRSGLPLIGRAVEEAQQLDG